MTTIAVLLAASAGGSPAVMLLVGVTVLVGQLSIGWANDWLDAPADEAAERPDKPVATGAVPVRTVRTASLLALTASVPLSFVAGVVGVWNLVLVVAGWAYNLAGKGAVWSPVPYAVGFAALPAYAVGATSSVVPWWMPAAGALLGVSAHFANAAPDAEIDRAAGIRGLPQRLGPTRSLLVAFALLGVAGAMVVAQLDVQETALAVGVAVVTVPVVVGLVLTSRGCRGRVVFTLVMVAAVADVVVVLLAA